MFKTLFAYYSPSTSASLKQSFIEDFEVADKLLLVAVIGCSLIAAFITSLKFGYFTLGIVGGLAVSIISTLAYVSAKGTAMCRIIMATALVCLLAIMVQQSNGLGEGHFLFFLGFTILIRYRDFLPTLVFVGLTVVHHFTLTYCQSIGVEVLDSPLIIFSWGSDSEWGLITPLAYHVVFALMGVLVSGFYIFDGNKSFVESQLVILAVESSAAGDLSTRIDTHAADTLLISKINRFLENLDNVFTQVGTVSKELSSQSSQSEQAASEQVQQAQLQQDKITQVATAVTEMASVTQEIATNAEQTADASSNTVNITDIGSKLANNCQASIGQLADQVQQAGSIISELDRNSQQISSIVQTISSIAEQTNLLALNAAIEAARAGEQGRGFAVVADEVRVLSQRTHTSTEEITAMISSLQTSTQSAVQTMTSCHELASTSVEDSEKATQSFAEIANAIKNISDMATQIATAAEEQSAVTCEIDRNANSISEDSQQFSLNASHNQQQATQLNSQSKTMQGLLGNFKGSA